MWLTLKKENSQPYEYLLFIKFIEKEDKYENNKGTAGGSNRNGDMP